MPLEKPWLCHYPQEIDPTYDYPRQNVAQFLIDAAQEYPTRPALEFMGKQLSYERLLEECCRFANALVRLGIGRQERVAIMLPNCPQTVIAYYGTLMAGCIAVLTNPLYKERELAIQLADSGAAAIITLDVLYPRVRAAQARTTLRHAIITSIKDYLPFPKNVLFALKMKKMFRQQGSLMMIRFMPSLRCSKAFRQNLCAPRSMENMIWHCCSIREGRQAPQKG